MTGQEFVKKLRPFGCVLVLTITVLSVLLCFTSGANPIPGYASPQSTEYYRENLPELKAELEQNVFPELDGIIDCEITGGTLSVTIDNAWLAVSRSAVLRYFDKSLFLFITAQGD